MEPNQNLLTTELHIDAIGHTHLKETAMWARFLGIVGIVVSILLVIIALFAGSFLATLGSGMSTTAPVGAGLISGIYIIIAAIYFVISLFVFRFGVRMKSALRSSDQDVLNGAFHNLKLVYRILGIIMIIYIGLMALGIVAAIGMSAMR